MWKAPAHQPRPSAGSARARGRSGRWALQLPAPAAAQPERRLSHPTPPRFACAHLQRTDRNGHGGLRPPPVLGQTPRTRPSRTTERARKIDPYLIEVAVNAPTAQPIAFGSLPGRAHLDAPADGARVLLISTYELGHQPLGLASAAAALRRAGHDVRTLDVAVEPLAGAALRAVDLIAISVPMHTAARIALQVVEAIREAKIGARLVCFGLYASPLAEHLGHRAIEVVGGEYEAGLVEVAAQVAAHRSDAVAGSGGTPSLARQQYPIPDRRGLPGLDQYARVRRADGEHLAGYVEATRGCAHTCRHCPITPVYGGALRLVQRDTVLGDIAQQVEAGAHHITFGDPDFLNAVPHSMAILEEAHRRWPALTFDVTIKVEHLIEHAYVLGRLKGFGVIWITSAFESCNNAILE
ncbi:MAG: hypothetical protein EPO65_11855, partial [Dehalococcoidia bacterium]